MYSFPLSLQQGTSTAVERNVRVHQPSPDDRRSWKEMRMAIAQDKIYARCGGVEPGQFPFKGSTLVIAGFFERCSFDLFHYADAISLSQ